MATWRTGGDNAEPSFSPPAVLPQNTGAGPVSTIQALADIPEEKIWLAKQKSARTRRAYRLDVRHFMRTLHIASYEELRQVDHRAVIAWERGVYHGRNPLEVQPALALVALYRSFPSIDPRRVAARPRLFQAQSCARRLSGCARIMMENTLSLHPSPPFRLDVTAWALQRRPGNLIDRWDGKTYRHVVVVEDDPFEITVTQTGMPGDRLRVIIHGEIPHREARATIKQRVANALGARVDLDGFYRLAARNRKLALLASRFRGLKPPRFFSIFEGLINGIACQQLSLSLGLELLNRLVQSFSLTVHQGDSLSYAFPRPQDLANAEPEAIRKLGFNFQKARAIIEVSRAIVEGRLDLEALASTTDEEAIQRLMELRGVGRWTAEYTLLRGMGRWHIFPLDDQGARNGLMQWLHLRKPLDARHAERIVARWRPYGGLIYFHMLMNGLDKAGRLSSPDLIG